MNPLDAIALGLAVFYAAYVVTKTYGPYNVFMRLRGDKPDGTKAQPSRLGGLLVCFYCVTFWAAVVAYILLIVFPPALYIVAAAGAASFLYRYTGADLT